MGKGTVSLWKGIAAPVFLSFRLEQSSLRTPRPERTDNRCVRLGAQGTAVSRFPHQHQVEARCGFVTKWVFLGKNRELADGRPWPQPGCGIGEHTCLPDVACVSYIILNKDPWKGPSGRGQPGLHWWLTRGLLHPCRVPGVVSAPPTLILKSPV